MEKMSEEQKREKIAYEFKRKLYRNIARRIPRKAWFPAWLEKKGISRRTLYNYCNRYNIATR